LLLSQLSRTSCHEKEKPQLHHLRDSGAIEQDAAAVIFISEHPDNTSFAMDRKVIVDVAANRFGPPGETAMVFCPYIQKFRSTEFEGQQKQEAKGRRF
jgi:replicative DNA helicase